MPTTVPECYVKDVGMASSGSEFALSSLAPLYLGKSVGLCRDVNGDLVFDPSKKVYPKVRYLHDGEKKRILVTGGAAFVGSHLVDRLMMMGHQVTVVDNYFTGIPV